MSKQGPEVHHPLFARLCAVMSRKEPAQVREHRSELLSGLSGRVLELGAGAGANFGLYPTDIGEVIAVEPEPYLRAKAIEAAASAKVPVTVVDGTADRLPAEDASVDAAVACLVLCSVPDPPAALAELSGCCAPAASCASTSTSLRRAPGRAHPAHRRRVSGRVLRGLPHRRDTPAAIAGAGFAIDRERRLQVGPRFVPAATHVLGTARRA